MGKTYLALGDSMSIDEYTGVSGGGAVNQFKGFLGPDWTLTDRTFDGCTIPRVPRHHNGDVITLTIGGNDLLQDLDRYLVEGLEGFREAHRALLEAIRGLNPEALFIVGNVYTPAFPLDGASSRRLEEANAIIADDAAAVRAHLADIRGAFLGHETEYLTLGIEPTLPGAKAIADLFAGIFRQHR